MPTLQLLRKPKTPAFLLIGLIALYAIYFSWYTINRHDTLNSYAADLSLIDQPMWNTVLGPGGFMEQTWGDRQQPRLAEHFEPILIPLALLFFIWDNVRILLIAQSAALALGALPVFWIARKQFTRIKYFEGDRANEQPPFPHWAALAFATVYLLYPHLQAANIADFHADPFVVTPLLFAFWYASEQRWGWMWLWAFIAMVTKETLPTLTAMLGVWLLIKTYRQTKAAPEPPNHRSALIGHIAAKQGVALIGVSTVWFLVATFLIVAPLAAQYFGTEGPIYFANRYGGGWGEMLQDPARWRYLIGLLAAVGFLPLLAPELLILGLPLLLANFFSNFPGQYSGEQHYSAPLVVAFIIAAIYGTRRWTERTSLREINGQTLRMASLIGATLWILAWSLSYHALHGWTPLSMRTETYVTTPAARQVASLIDQIPAEAVVSASAAIHPHLAHRHIVYVFPTVEEADYIFVDVTDIPGVHPNDAKSKLLELLNSDWELLAATNGLILAQRTDNHQAEKSAELPADFFDFARTSRSPNQSAQLVFGDGRLQLMGYDVNDDPDDGVTFRLYWRATAPLPDNLSLWPLIYDDTGQLLSDPTQVPQIATVWYPPAHWQPGEIIVTETLPQLMPDTFHLGIAVGPQGSFDDPGQRYPVQKLDDTKSSALRLEPVVHRPTRLNPGNWAQLASFKRQGPFLDRLPATPRLQALTPVNIELGSTIHLTGFWLAENTLEPGTTLPLILRWVADKPPATDLTVFVHLLAPDGTLVAQSDGYPTWLSPTPTSQWSPNQPILDRHSLSLPNNLKTGLYTLRLGLYHAQTLERLPLSDGDDAISLSQIRIE